MAQRRPPKKEALDLIQRLAPGVSWDDIMNEIYVRRKIEAGLAAADEGRVVTHEEVKRRFVRRS
jgi:hypothetical protein